MLLKNIGQNPEKFCKGGFIMVSLWCGGMLFASGCSIDKVNGIRNSINFCFKKAKGKVKVKETSVAQKGSTSSLGVQAHVCQQTVLKTLQQEAIEALEKLKTAIGRYDMRIKFFYRLSEFYREKDYSNKDSYELLADLTSHIALDSKQPLMEFVRQARQLPPKDLAGLLLLTLDRKQILPEYEDYQTIIVQIAEKCLKNKIDCSDDSVKLLGVEQNDLLLQLKDPVPMAAIIVLSELADGGKNIVNTHLKEAGVVAQAQKGKSLGTSTVSLLDSIEETMELIYMSPKELNGLQQAAEKAISAMQKALKVFKSVMKNDGNQEFKSQSKCVMKVATDVIKHLKKLKGIGRKTALQSLVVSILNDVKVSITQLYELQVNGINIMDKFSKIKVQSPLSKCIKDAQSLKMIDNIIKHVKDGNYQQAKADLESLHLW